MDRVRYWVGSTPVSSSRQEVLPAREDEQPDPWQVYPTRCIVLRADFRGSRRLGWSGERRKAVRFAINMDGIGPGRAGKSKSQNMSIIRRGIYVRLLVFHPPTPLGYTTRHLCVARAYCPSIFPSPSLSPSPSSPWSYVHYFCSSSTPDTPPSLLSSKASRVSTVRVSAVGAIVLPCFAAVL